MFIARVCATTVGLLANGETGVTSCACCQWIVTVVMLWWYCVGNLIFGGEFPLQWNAIGFHARTIRFNSRYIPLGGNYKPNLYLPSVLSHWAGNGLPTQNGHTISVRLAWSSPTSTGHGSIGSRGLGFQHISFLMPAWDISFYQEIFGEKYGNVQHACHAVDKYHILWTILSTPATWISFRWVSPRKSALRSTVD